MHVDEVANACEFFLRKKTNNFLINIGSSIEMSIKNYANLIKNKIDSEGLVKFDNNRKLDGVMRKKLNLSLANSYGWKSRMNFSKVLDEIIEDFKSSYK